MQNADRSSGGSSTLFPSGFEPVIHQDTSADNRQLFFAKVSKSAGEDEVKLLFSEYGDVQDVIIFQSSQGGNSSKGCGLVTMSTHEEAATALAGLHGKFAWSNRDPPMVVTWMDAALQDPARQHNLQTARLGPKAPLPLHRGTPRPLDLVADGADTPPVGCDPDAIKLFVGNIPLNYTEEQLLPLFQQLGPVIELVVVRNKLNSLSKGCAFVWFAVREHAETAISALNLKHMLPDMSGQQHRPLVVRKARTGHMLGGLQKGDMAPDPRFRMPGMQAATGGSMRAGLSHQLVSHQPMHASLMNHMGQPQTFTRGAAVNAGQYLTQPNMIGHSAQLVNQRYGMGQTPMLNSAIGGYATVNQFGGVQYHSVGQDVLHQNQPLTLHTSPNGTTYVQAAPAVSQPQYQVMNTSQGPVQYMNNNQGQTQYVSGSQAQGQFVSNGQGQYVPSVQSQAQYTTGVQGQQQQYQLVDMGGSAHTAQHLGPGNDSLEQYVPVQSVQLNSGMDSGLTQATGARGSAMGLDTSQLSLVNDHLFSIQSSTGCTLMVSPGGPGVFNLLISGAHPQVERAQLMLASLLSNDSAANGKTFQGSAARRRWAGLHVHPNGVAKTVSLESVLHVHKDRDANGCLIARATRTLRL